jgi:hypothetical protein
VSSAFAGQSPGSEHHREILSVDLAVAVDVGRAGAGFTNAKLLHTESNVVCVIVAVTVHIAIDVGVYDTATTRARFCLQWIIGATVEAISRTVRVTVGIVGDATTTDSFHKLQRVIRTLVNAISRTVRVTVGINSTATTVTRF